jgi:hypothetical protein
MSEAKPKQENALTSLLVNIVIPVCILTFLSKEKYLGPVWALVVGLAFPICYGLRTLIRSRKADFIAIIGVVSVTLTGVFGILELPRIALAIKEAAVPLIIGLAMVISLKTPFPLIKKILMTEALFDVKRLTSALKEKQSEAAFEKRLIGLTWGFSSSMFLSSGLNFVLVMMLIHSDPVTQKEAYIAEIGKMTGWSYVVVLLPCLVIMFFVMNKLFDTLVELTGCELDDLLAAHHRKEKAEKPAEGSCPSE